jgi:hypothetical protein
LVEKRLEDHRRKPASAVPLGNMKALNSGGTLAKTSQTTPSSACSSP